MRTEPEKVVKTYYILYEVTFPDGNEGEIERKAGYFVDNKEATKVASLKLPQYI